MRFSAPTGAPSPAELAGVFDQWALGEGIRSQFGEEQIAVLARAFIAGYWHAMAINAAELETVKQAGRDVFRDGGAKGPCRLAGAAGAPATVTPL
jgi:hypothetical protein